jgi:hypothetical protein
VSISTPAGRFGTTQSRLHEPSNPFEYSCRCRRLSQGAVDSRKLRVDRGFYSGNSDEYPERYSCGDQAIFDCRCSSLIRNEPANGAHWPTTTAMIEAKVNAHFLPELSVERIGIAEAICMIGAFSMLSSFRVGGQIWHHVLLERWFLPLAS